MIIDNLIITASIRMRNPQSLLPIRVPNDAVALTFDDGPDPRFTGSLLDLLKAHDIKATFFIVGKFAEENPDILQRMADEGHSIGIHTWEHRCPVFQNSEYSSYELRLTREIASASGKETVLFRPAWGTFNRTTIHEYREMGLVPVLWNVMAEDWRGNTTADVIKKKLIKRTQGGDIVCLHDGRGENDAPSRTIKALESVIPVWKNKGYRFLTMDEIIGKNNG